MTTITISWQADVNPSKGWNIYHKHNSTPDAVAYTGTYAPSERQAVLHNIQPGLTEVGISRVEEYIDGEVSRPVEGPVQVYAFFVAEEGDVAIPLPGLVDVISVVVNHDG